MGQEIGERDPPFWESLERGETWHRNARRAPRNCGPDRLLVGIKSSQDGT